MTVEPAPERPRDPGSEAGAGGQGSRSSCAPSADCAGSPASGSGSLPSGPASPGLPTSSWPTRWPAVKPPEEDPTLRPEHYAPILDFPEQPDRPKLSRFERTSADEAISIERVARFVSASVVRSYTDLRKADVAAKATRAQHAKHHGCVQASFIVHQNLAPEHAIGVFRPGAKYSAVIRFSNSKGVRESDKSKDGRGMAIKLRNVPGKNILSDQIPQAGLAEQDFLISGHPVFFCRDAADYTVFMAMLDCAADDARGEPALLGRVREVLPDPTAACLHRLRQDRAAQGHEPARNPTTTA